MRQSQQALFQLTKKYPIFGVLHKDTYIEFNTYFFGPLDFPSPFQGQAMEIRITLTNKFPASSPSIGVAADTIWHPNIDFHSGSVCVDQLNSTWNSSIDLVTIIEDILPSLFLSPNPDDPLNIDAAKQFKSSHDQYAIRAKEIIERKALSYNDIIKNFDPNQKIPEYFENKLKEYHLYPGTEIKKATSQSSFQKKNCTVQLRTDDDDIGL
ncbi:Ubiquitin-conjugating_enzyme E2 [Hexamita inflata]|uniref:Ubiquitin-conjugating enzyme E2 n=1 Tax=Hexamita inflata TaxID=28002 RepID=A0AA86U413_9EUKA|nr:Ubiquitin-conjugating enzyme E2 [Hexamita inflata]